MRRFGSRSFAKTARDKRLVGILSLGDIAKSADRIGVTRALGDIAQSCGQHNQVR